jgi:hypothetical protein
MLTRTQILAIVPTLKREEVDVPEWSGSVYVREMTGLERDRFEVVLIEGKRANFRALIAAFTVCDEDGQRIFTEADAKALAGQPASAMDRISTVALRLNAITASDVEDAAKNSGSGPSDASP